MHGKRELKIECVDSEFIGLYIVRLYEDGKERYLSKQITEDDMDVMRDAMRWLSGSTPEVLTENFKRVTTEIN